MHVAIIMDGNRRWAAARGLGVWEGHRAGERALHRIVESALDLGIDALTVFAFSTENRKRPPGEVSALMELCASFARAERDMIMRRGIRLRICGELSACSLPARTALERLERETAAHSALTLTLAINYSGRDEIARAATSIARAVSRGELDPDDITEQTIRSRLYLPDMPDPDLLIRTGGELRLSNFLLYQLAYTELVVLETLWPDFTGADLAAAVGEFGTRERRFGA